MSIISDDNNIYTKQKTEKNPITKPESIEYDKNFENSIRPKSFETYIGQTALCSSCVRRDRHHLYLWLQCMQEEYPYCCL